MENLCEPTFSGYDGEGVIDTYPEQGKIDYDMTKEGISTFLYDVTYTVDKTEGLSNGDEVTITAEYSKQTAKALKLKVTKDSMKVKVSGLIGRYKDGNDISEANLKLIKRDMDKCAKEAVEYHYGYRDEPFSFQRLALLFAKEGDNESSDHYCNDMLVGIYQAVCGDETEYFVVESDTSVDSETDFKSLGYNADSFQSHFAYGLASYLDEDVAFTLTEIGASEKRNGNLEDWYSSSYAASSTIIYPATVYPSVRPDRWEVVVKKNKITYEFTYDDKFDADMRKELHEEIGAVMKEEENVFQELLEKILKESGAKEGILHIKYEDKKGIALYDCEFTK